MSKFQLSPQDQECLDNGLEAIANSRHGLPIFGRARIEKALCLNLRFEELLVAYRNAITVFTQKDCELLDMGMKDVRATLRRQGRIDASEK